MNNEEKILALLEKMDGRLSSLEAGQRSDRELLELTASQVGHLTNDMDGVKADINSVKADINGVKADINGMKDDFNGVKAELVNVKSEVEKTNLTMERNHSEVIGRLDRLESNQDAIKEFILNSDDTFRKSEEAYDVIQRFREVLNK